MNITARANILLVLAIVVTVLAYSFSWAQFLYFVGPLLLFFALQECEGKLWFRGFIFGTFFYGLSLLWLFEALPLDWAGVMSPSFGFFLVLLLWISMTLVLSIIPSTAAQLWRVNDNTFFRAGIIATVWAASEYAIAFGSSLIVSGDGAVFGAHWAWISIGDLLAGSLLFSSVLRFGGVFAGSFFVIFVSSVLVGLATGKRKKEIFIFGLLLVVIIVASLLGNAPEKNPQSLKVAAIQTDNHEKSFITWERQREIWQETRNIINTVAQTETDIDVLVLPEDLRFSFIEGIEREQLLPKTLKESVVLIDSGRRGGSGTALGVRYLSRDGEILGEHNKTMLVPAGEYMPYIVEFISKILRQGEFLKRFESLRKTALGDDAKSVEINNVSYGTLPCTAVLSPILYRDLVRDGADVLINTASQSLLNGNTQVLEQLRRRSQIHAASLSRPYVQASNGGEGLVIDKNGVVSQQSDIGEGYIVETITIKRKMTLYTIWGNWWLGGFLLLVLILTTQKYFIHKQKIW